MPRIRIPASLRRLVIERARECCEYCLLHLIDAEYAHEIDHLIAIKHGGKTIIENLVFACFKCNRRKGSDLSAIDPIDKVLVPLFNPRTQVWAEHFTLVGAFIVGQTQVGRATVALLELNSDARLERRQALMDAGHYPPPWMR
jgi:hypothetical protein